MTTRYVVLAYGDDDRPYRQAWMLFVSLAAYAPPPARFVVLTDHPERFAWSGESAVVERLAPGQIDAWRGGASGWRHKLEAERAQIGHDDALVMLDSDIVAIRPLDPLVSQLHQGALFMHKQEYVLGTSRRAGNRRLWRMLRDQSFGAWRILPGDAMWNAGVVALRRHDRGLIDDALSLHDAMASSAKHLFLEQLATSIVLGRTTRLQPALPFFAHYWGNKGAFDAEIARRLAAAQSLGQSLQEAAASYRTDPIALPVEVRPGPFAKAARWLRRRA